jgi:hypothetical protein
VFDGNIGDPMTLAAQIEKLKLRFCLDPVTVVGDRGMITNAQYRGDQVMRAWVASTSRIPQRAPGGLLTIPILPQACP